MHLEPVVTREEIGENIFGTWYVTPNGVEIFQEVLTMFEGAFVGSFEEGVEVDQWFVIAIQEEFAMEKVRGKFIQGPSDGFVLAETGGIVLLVCLELT